MGRDGFSIEEAFHVIAKNGPIEVYKRDVTRTGTGEFWMYTEEYFYPRQCKLFETTHILNLKLFSFIVQFTSSRLDQRITMQIALLLTNTS